MPATSTLDVFFTEIAEKLYNPNPLFEQAIFIVNISLADVYVSRTLGRGFVSSYNVGLCKNTYYKKITPAGTTDKPPKFNFDTIDIDRRCIREYSQKSIIDDYDMTIEDYEAVEKRGARYNVVYHIIKVEQPGMGHVFLITRATDNLTDETIINYMDSSIITDGSVWAAIFYTSWQALNDKYAAYKDEYANIMHRYSNNFNNIPYCNINDWGLQKGVRNENKCQTIVLLLLHRLSMDPVLTLIPIKCLYEKERNYRIDITDKSIIRYSNSWILYMMINLDMDYSSMIKIEILIEI
jgi:hypothetical protein